MDGVMAALFMMALLFGAPGCIAYFFGRLPGRQGLLVRLAILIGSIAIPAILILASTAYVDGIYAAATIALLPLYLLLAMMPVGIGYHIARRNRGEAE